MALFNTHPLYLSLLSEYAAGVLAQEHRMMVAAHLSLSAQARQFIRQCEALSAALIERECAPVSMAETALESVLGRIEQRTQPQPTEQRRPWPSDLTLPEAIQLYLNQQIQRQQTEWQHECDGVDTFDVPTPRRATRLRMTRLAPGYVREPQIRETRTEITLVLNGGMSSQSEQYQTGTLVIREHRSTEFQACKNQGCVYIRLSEILE